MGDCKYRGSLIVYKQSQINPFGAEIVEELILLASCRPCSSLLHTSSLISSTLFIEGGTVHDEKAQQSTIYKWKEFLKVN